MGVQRKCSNCNTWNKDEQYCVNCNTLLDPQLIEVEREKVREYIRENAVPSKVDVFLNNWKNSNYLVFRLVYKVLYSIVVVFGSIIAFFVWLTATPYA